jgi:UDP-2,3-diacylglucosamine hydrolase
MSTLFISDLHLTDERPETIHSFLQFLAGPARRAESLYILGDLFEAWVGDDDDSAGNTAVVSALADYTRHGSFLFFMHGNRDFLVGADFAAATGCTLLPEHYVVDLYGIKTLLMHGDILCTDDTDYQVFRRQVRNPEWQQTFLNRSLAERRFLAKLVRNESIASTQRKSPEIMDVHPNAVMQTMQEYGVCDLIHGHTHRPAVHEFAINGKPARRIVLGDWYDQDSVLICDSGKRELTRIASLI